MSRSVPQPIGCFTEPVRVSRPLEDHPFTRNYVKATADESDGRGPDAFWAAADRARSSPAWSYREVATGHMVPVNRPEALAAILLELS